MIKLARGWSDKFQTTHCKTCHTKRRSEIIQYQNKASIGRIPIFGRGSREFGMQCTKCGNINKVPADLIKQVRKLKYYDKKGNQKSKTVDAVRPGKKVIKYPVLDEKRRVKIIKQNRKEGFISLGLGLVIAIVIGPFSSFWSATAAIVFTFGGLYAAYEDPERKHRDLIRAGKLI